MNLIQIVVLTWAIAMVAAIALVRGADMRAGKRMHDIEQRKKRINWPSSH